MQTGSWYRKLHWQVLIALVAGAVLGSAAPELGREAGFIGELFLRLLKMIIIPLIFLSLVDGMTSLGDVRTVGRVGVRTLLYYTVTTTLAIVVGLSLVNLLHPGVGLTLGARGQTPEGLQAAHASLADFVLRLVPDNVIDAMARGDVLPVITFAILFGLVLTGLDENVARPVTRVVSGVLEVIQRLTMGIIRLAPIGIFGLIARAVGRSGIDLIIGLWPYFLTVVLSLLIHATVTLALLLAVLGRRSPIAYARSVLPALVTAFSTASSSATLPLSMECAEHQAGLPKGVVSFVLPLGATVNMDGTALYEAVAALTIAQMYSIQLDLQQQIMVLITALLASVGAAGIPMAGLVMLVIVLDAVGLPLEGIGVIIAVDSVLDMMRTTTNVWSDLVGTAVISRFEGRTA